MKTKKKQEEPRIGKCIPNCECRRKMHDSACTEIRGGCDGAEVTVSIQLVMSEKEGRVVDVKKRTATSAVEVEVNGTGSSAQVPAQRCVVWSCSTRSATRVPLRRRVPYTDHHTTPRAPHQRQREDESDHQSVPFVLGCAVNRLCCVEGSGCCGDVL